MQYHRLGNSSLNVSQVCLGTMTWGQQNSRSEAHAQLDLAVDAGINFFDSAEMYPVPARAETQGATETILGSWLADHDRGRYMVASKVIGKSNLTWIRGGGLLNRDHIRQALEDSLRRLRTDYIDLYQVHWPDRYVPKFGGFHFEPSRYSEGTPILETIEVLAELIGEGKIRYYGLSNETPYGLSQYIRLAEQHGLPKPVSIQNAYNLLNRVFEIHLAETCFHENIMLLAYSPLGFGYLTGKYRAGVRPERARVSLFPHYVQRYQGKANAAQAIEAYAALAGADGLARLALRFIKNRPLPNCVIIGASNLDQLRENLAHLQGELSPERAAAVEEIHRRYPNPCP